MTRDVSEVTHWKRGLRFVKSQLVEFCDRKKNVDFRLLAEALWRVRTWFGADGKVSIERWHLSPYVEKPLNSKVIKSFVPELRSRQVFFVFRDSYVIYIYELWTFYVHFTYSCMAMSQYVMYGYVSILVKWIKCSPMVQETWVQSQVESYQRLKNGTWWRLA